MDGDTCFFICVWISFGIAFLVIRIKGRRIMAADETSNTDNRKKQIPLKDGTTKAPNKTLSQNEMPKLTNQGEILFIEINHSFLLDDMNRYLASRGVNTVSSVSDAIALIEKMAPKYHAFAKQGDHWGFWRIDYGK